MSRQMRCRRGMDCPKEDPKEHPKEHSKHCPKDHPKDHPKDRRKDRLKDRLKHCPVPTRCPFRGPRALRRHLPEVREAGRPRI